MKFSLLEIQCIAIFLTSHIICYFCTMITSLSLPLPVIVLLAVALVLTAALALWHLLRTRRLARWQREHEPAQVQEEDESLAWPGVSVVVYARADEVHWLDDHLPLLLEQDYPCFDVIVVADGCNDQERDQLSQLLPQNSRLRVCFLPDGTRALSRRKLSLMLGIKASTQPVVLITNANCRPASGQWLRTIMRHFAQEPEVQLVLGYSHPRWHDDKGPGRRYRALDHMTVSMQWLLSAIGGRPYRGTGQNLAFTRELFFSHNGYAASMDLKWGDDDVWVSEVANAAGTRLELSSQSHMIACSHDAKLMHSEAKLRRDFTTQRVVTRAPMRREALASTAGYLRLAALIAAVAVGWQWVLADALALVLLIAGWPLSIIPCRRAARVLGAPRLGASVPFLRLWRPLVNVRYRLRGQRFKQSNYTSIYD